MNIIVTRMKRDENGEEGVDFNIGCASFCRGLFDIIKLQRY